MTTGSHHPNTIVTLKEVFDVPHAQLIQSYLDAHGIDSYLPDLQINTIYAGAFGGAFGVRIQVRSGDLEEALGLVNELELAHRDEEKGATPDSSISGQLDQHLQIDPLAKRRSLLLQFGALPFVGILVSLGIVLLSLRSWHDSIPSSELMVEYHPQQARQLLLLAFFFLLLSGGLTALTMLIVTG